MCRTSRAFFGTLALVLFILAGFGATAQRALAQETIKVAPLDMSSMSGHMMGFGGQGYGGPGYGGMGWGGRGQGMMGPGMMGPGGPGGWGPGMMGPGGWGPGMMGAGMMGMMSIRPTKSTVKAGKIRFEVVNFSTSVVHEMEIVAVDNFNTPFGYDYQTGKAVVDKSKEKGEVEDIGPGATKVLEATLPAGNYLLLCNLPGHYGSGMVTPFVVTP